MKKLISSLILFLSMYSAIVGQKAAGSLSIQPGDKLIYQVNFNGDVYNFEVLLKTIGENEISFDYDMPTKANSASIVITKEAAMNATAYQNYFNGQDQTFTDKSTVWLSKKNFNELIAGSSVMNVGPAGNETFEKKETASHTFKYNGKDMSVDGFRIDNGKSNSDHRQLWILNNESNPLILKMNLGWTIELKEVIPAK